MARKLLKDDPLDNEKPDLMDRAIQRGVGMRREAESTDEENKYLNKEINPSIKQESNQSINKSADVKMVTTRLPDELDQRVKMYALKKRKKKEDVFREALEYFLDAMEDE
jgi:hypothetical protein